MDQRSPMDQALFLYKTGKVEAAKRACAKILKRDPRHAPARSLLGMLHLQGGAVAKAAGELRKAVEDGACDAGTFNGLALALSGLSHFDEAIDAQRAAVRLRPRMAQLQVNLGNIQMRARKLEEAIASYRAALRLDAREVTAQIALANAYLALGEISASEAVCRRVLEIDPNNASAFYHLARSAKLDLPKIERQRIDHFEALVRSGALSESDLALCHNALGFIADQAGDYDSAFRHFQAFNRLTSARLERSGQAFDRAGHRKRIEQTMATFSAAFFDRHSGGGSDSDRPIFVVGLPRSGTTLVEQIIGAHHDVVPGGESLQIPRLAERVPGYPAGISSCSAAAVQSMAASYLSSLESPGASAAHVTDKLPTNFLHVGFIHLLFPAARIVHCRRDVRDTSLSYYFQNFSGSDVSVRDLESLGDYVEDYQRLMAHWNAVLPGRLIAVDYEKIVADGAGEIRRLIAVLGLDWDESCLSFHESAAPVLTASQLQVRQRIFATSVGRWQHYARHLGPLFDRLEDDGPGGS